MLDSIYHMTLKLLKNHISCVKCYATYLKTASGLSILLHGVISLPDATSCDKEYFHPKIRENFVH